MSQAADQLVRNTPVAQRQLYQSYAREEALRISYHYNVPPEFFTTITGGRWHCYSSSIFEGGDSLTAAQERKFGIYADRMCLRKDMRVLDIGSGWGGPLTYLAKQYGINGTGISVSAEQVRFARERAVRQGVDIAFEVRHWADFEDKTEFDAICTDEMLAHVSTPEAFYRKCSVLLKRDGRLVNKELYLNSLKHQDWLDRLSMHVNQVFGFTGNYRLLKDDVQYAEAAGFEVEDVLDIPMEHYANVVRNHWIPNLVRNKKYLVELTSQEHVADIYKYLRGTLICFRNGTFNQKMVTFVRR